MLVMLSEPMESSGMKDTEDYQAGSGGRLTRSHGLASHDLAIQPTWKNRREGNIVLGDLVVAGLETAFREYFPNSLARRTEGTRNLRGFVQSLERDDWVDALCENRTEEYRLKSALETFDTFKTEGLHYNWVDFLNLLGGALGGGAVYKRGVGFVVSQEDGGALSAQDLCNKASQDLDKIDPGGDTREGFMDSLSKEMPEEYSSSPAAATRQRASSHPGPVPAGGSGVPMELDDPVDAEGSGSSLMPMLVVGDCAEDDKIAAGDINAGEDLIDRSIAELEKYLADERARSTTTQASTRSEVSNVELSSTGAAEIGEMLMARSARWKSVQQLLEDVEERIEAKTLLPKRARADSFLRKGPLSFEQEEEVDEAFDGGPLQEVLVNAFNTKLTRKDLICLHPLTWLNDEVVNMYMLLLGERDKKLCEQDPSRRRSHFFSSFFITKLKENGGYHYAGVRRWSRKIKVFELDKIFFPVNVSNMHWCMAVIYVQQKRIHYYDSMGGTGKTVMKCLLMWLEDEDDDKNKDKATFEPEDWTMVGTDIDTTPQQENGSDCGVFACSFASYASEDLPFEFSQADINQMRRRIMWSLLHQRLA
ncbi:unnamed protein product [Ascophyllum nodosum]